MGGFEDNNSAFIFHVPSEQDAGSERIGRCVEGWWQCVFSVMKPEHVHEDYLEDISDAMVEVSLLTEAGDGKESARKKD